MSRRCDGITPPDYYRAALWRPNSLIASLSEQIAWDMTAHWLTASEWLAWCRRRYGGRKPFWDSRFGWHYPVRPMISSAAYMGSTLKIRRLP